MASFVCLCVCGGYDDDDDDDACEDVVPNFKEEERMAEVKCIGIEGGRSGGVGGIGGENLAIRVVGG